MSQTNSRNGIALRMQDIEPFRVMEILARARELEALGRDIVHMEIGEPDFASPPLVIAAAQQALAAGQTHYTPAQGLAQLRHAIAGFYQQRYGASVNAEQVIVTPGASGALLLALAVLLNPGDKVLMSDPTYPCNRHFVRLLEAQAVAIVTEAQDDFQPRLDQLQAHWDEKTRALMLASPANPTGTLLSESRLDQLLGFVQQQSGYAIVDEIYHGLVYQGQAATAAGRSSQVFVINSFSKYFCMTGWRLGWLVVPENFIEAAQKLAQNVFLAPATLSQYAALAAFQDDTLALLEQHRQTFAQRKAYLQPAIEQLGFKVLGDPQGAFYLYTDCSALTPDSFAFCRQLLEQQGVALTPGADFGTHNKNRYIRFSYATDVVRLKQGVARIRDFVR